MNNIYYTPIIEEFHVGFEYERNEPHRIYYLNNSPIEYKWVNHKWDEKQTRIGGLKCEINDKNIRVKYLDKEDIESLGWIKGYQSDPDNGETKEHSCNHFEYILKDIDVNNGLSNRNVDFKLNFINVEHSLKIKFYDRNHFDWFPCYEGMIKNKSELKKLMKQLGINE